MIDLADSEAGLAFAALIPDFRPNARGQYRGPATYRGGDNKTALSVDLRKGGRYFDHVTDEGGDAITFAIKACGCTFVEACRVISEIIGRSLLDGTAKRRPRINDEDLATTELFRVGFCWELERYLEPLKELWALDGSAVQSDHIRNVTRLLVRMQAGPMRDIRDFMRRYRRVQPWFVAGCIREANEMQMGLATAISSVAPGVSAVA